NGDSKTLEEFEFQRGSSGTYFDASGVMQLAAPNVPRINYDAGISKGLLIEPASSNLTIDSGINNGLDSFSTKSAAGLSSVETNFNIGNLFNRGVKIELGSTTTYVYKPYVFAVGTMYTFSLFIKMEDGSVPTTGDLAIIIQGTVSQDLKIINCGNNVYRLISSRVGIAASNNYGIAKHADKSAKSFVVTGFQLEEGPVATS